MMNEDYMMDIFSSIAIKVDPFAEYLEFMFTEKQSKPVAGCKSEDEKFCPMVSYVLNYVIHPEFIFHKLMVLFHI